MELKLIGISVRIVRYTVARYSAITIYIDRSIYVTFYLPRLLPLSSFSSSASALFSFRWRLLLLLAFSHLLFVRS